MPAGDPRPSAPVPSTGAARRFEFATATRIVFGSGSSSELPALAAAFGRRLLLVGGSNPRRFGGLVAALENSFEAVECLSLPDEPTVDFAAAGAVRARTVRAEVVVAIGGGSALDAGKAIAALAANPGEPLDYLEVVGSGRPLPHPSLPFIAVPTTAGTGAEVTRNAVLTVPSARLKASLRSPHLFPRVALVDPALALDLPPAPTAATGMDALTQLIEPYLSLRANPLADALCRDGIARAARALPRVFRAPADLAARSEMALAALYSGLALANAGLGAVHGFAAPIGGLYPAPHGAVCAALLPHVLRVNLAALRERAPQSPALARFDELGPWLTGDAAARADDAVAWCARIARELAIPPLARWGIDAGACEAIAEKAAGASSMKGNPLALSHAELLAIIHSALAA